jgi:repressor LexA
MKVRESSTVEDSFELILESIPASWYHGLTAFTRVEVGVKGSTELRDQPDAVVAALPCRGYTNIRDFMQGCDSPATVLDVCHAVGLSVSYRLSLLERKGDLRGSASPYTVEAWRSGYPALHIDAGDLPGGMKLPSLVGAAVLVPVCGQIPAGPLNLANQAVESAFLLDKQSIGEGTFFMLKVVGDSMINAGITDGDWVVVRQQKHAQNGEIVAALVGGEVTVKTLHRDKTSLLGLVPQNPDYQPIPVAEPTSILGKVVGVVCQA